MFKIIPREESHKLTADQIVGRKVIIETQYERGPFGGKTGVVIDGDGSRETIHVTWDGAGTFSHAWGCGRGSWQVQLIDDSLEWSPTSDAQANGRLRGMSAEARLFFGEPATEPHPFLRMRDERKKK